MVLADQPPGKKTGVWGGGQLALMLAQAAQELKISFFAYSESEEDPIHAVLPPEKIYCLAQDPGAAENFLKNIDVLTFENEFIPEKALQKIQASGVPCLPSLEALNLFRNKFSQKQLFQNLKISTSPFALIKDLEDFDRFRKTEPEVVCKWALGGYDGKGVLLNPERKEVERFIYAAKEKKAPVYAERKISFLRELSLLSVVFKSGELYFFPVFISEQENGICRRVWGPASAYGLRPEQEQQLNEWSRILAQATQYVGVFAMEVFELASGELLLNEVAPRVHNSGHVTQEAFMYSQFHMHLLALSENGAILENRPQSAYYGMWNLLGPSDLSEYKNLEAMAPEEHLGKLHWYHKKKIGLLRKLGHLNFLGENQNSISEHLKQAAEYENQWHQYLKGRP